MENRSMLFLALLASALLLHNAASLENPTGSNEDRARCKGILDGSSELVAVALPQKNSAKVLIDMKNGEIYPESNLTDSELIPLCDQSSPNDTLHIRCKNAIAFADPKKKTIKKTGTIRYMLKDVEEAKVRGHSKYHNEILEINLKKPSVIEGGSTSNHYGIDFADSYVQFHLNSASQNETIDLSNAETSENVSIQFSGGLDSIYGYLKFDESCPAILGLTGNLSSENRDMTKLLAIHGRKDKRDVIECSNHEMIELLGKAHKIYADGNGGLDGNALDILTNCLQNEVRPRTIYNASYKDMKYDFNAYLESTSLSVNKNRDNRKSRIVLNEADAVVTVNDIQKFLGYQLISMIYCTKKNKLKLLLLWSDDIELELTVEGILKNLGVDTHIQSLKNVALLIKNANDSLIPVVKQDKTSNQAVTIKKFHMDILMSGMSLQDAHAQYNGKVAPHTSKWDIETLVTSSSTNSTFYYGTSDEDSIDIEKMSKYAEGQKGEDIYKLTSNSPTQFWINNSDTDGKFDILNIEPNLCKSITAEKRQINDSLMINSLDDVTVRCRMKKRQSKDVVLMNYMQDKSSRHIKIWWNNQYYLILPRNWLFSNEYDSKTLILLKIIDLTGNQSHSIELDGISGFWVIHVLDKPSEQLKVKRVADHNLLLATNSANSSITLVNFFDDEDEVSEHWMNKIFFVVSDLGSDEAPHIFKGLDLESLAESITR